MISTIYAGTTTVLPSPTEFDVGFNTQNKTAERNGNGRLVRETLPNKWTMNMNWEFKTPEEFYDLFTHLKSLTRVDFDAVFPSPDGTTQTITCYISPLSATMINLSRGTTGWWKNLKCTFVEV